MRSAPSGFLARIPMTAQSPFTGSTRSTLLRTVARAATVFLSALVLVAAPGRAVKPTPPELLVEAPPGLERRAQAIRAIDPETLLPAVERTGLEDPGGPIHVILAPETSPLAQVPRWIVGYAWGNRGTVVLLPERVPTYPNGSLEEVLRHEVGHVLIDRAAHFRPVPRWFHEGLAMAVAGEWGLRDRSEVGLALLGGQRKSLAHLDESFNAGAREAEGAYALSAAFVRYLDRRYGPHLPALLLERISEGRSFEQAFRDLTGLPLAGVEGSFWRQEAFWIRWFPLITSSTVLWAMISLLAVLAFRRRRERDREMQQQWLDEEAAEAHRARLRAELAELEAQLAELSSDDGGTVH
ncbi:MAG: hypothetical protein KDD11_05695 [Acidobacteria bacterium]|nr:hypothetical protein [Acidobacteriota bacterium]